MKPNRRTLLVVDLSYQVYRAAAAHDKLRSLDGEFTGGLYGFLTTLAKQIRETRATHVVIGEDRKPYRRSLEYPEYKQLRKKNANEDLLELHKASMPLVRRALECLTLPTWGVDGFEYDDLMAHTLRRYRHRYGMIYAASNDSDLYQLLGFSNFAVLRKEMADAVTLDNLMAGPLGLNPEEFMLASALQGTHNDIAGIPGVGPVTAAKAVRDPALMRKFRDGHAELIDRNLRLIKLPHQDFPGDEELPMWRNGFSHRELYRFCSRFDIEVTKSMIDSFEQVNQ